MKQNRMFFSLAELKQPVNQWICIAFICVWCFWIMLYYFTQRTQALAEEFHSATAELSL